jgi:TRAP-type C4-dicarboxylate transport system permease small subunit
MNEAEMKTMTFVNIPAWILELILPLTFGLMAFRFALRTVRSFSFSVEMIRTRDQGTDE